MHGLITKACPLLHDLTWHGHCMFSLLSGGVFKFVPHNESVLTGNKNFPVCSLLLETNNFKTNLFIWFLYFETQQLKNIHNLYSQCLTQTLSKMTFFSSMEGVWTALSSTAFLFLSWFLAKLNLSSYILSLMKITILGLRKILQRMQS